MDTKPHVVILGAGISGLTLGWALKRKFGTSIQLSILEKQARVGGCIQSAHVDGFLFEQGPHTIRASGVDTLSLIEDLQLCHEVLGSNAAAQKRYVWTQNQLHAFPSGILSFLTNPLSRQFLWPVIRELWQPKGHGEETVADFFNRRFSPEFTETYVDPFISGIFAGNPYQLSLSACFPFFDSLEKEHGSLLKSLFARKKSPLPETSFQQKMAKIPLFSFRDGMDTIIKKLAADLKEHIHLETPVTSLNFYPNQVVINQNLQAHMVISTLAANALSPLLTSHAPALSGLLDTIPHTSIAAINLGWNQNVLTKKGFGYLVPSKEKESLLGMVWDSDIFPEQNTNSAQTRVCVKIGGAHFKNFTDYQANDFVQIALEVVKKHLHITVPPEVIVPKIMPHVIPQYTLGHSKKIEAIQNFHPRMKIIGHSFYGISINDCISQALKTAENLQGI